MFLVFLLKLKNIKIPDNTPTPIIPIEYGNEWQGIIEDNPPNIIEIKIDRPKTRELNKMDFYPFLNFNSLKN